MAEEMFNREIVNSIREHFLDVNEGMEMNDLLIGASEILLSLLTIEAKTGGDPLMALDAITNDMREALVGYLSSAGAVQ